MFYKKERSGYIGILTLVLAFFAGSVGVMAQDGNVVDVVKESENHTIFAELMETAQVEEVLSQEGPYTVIAPTDDAFQKLGSDFEIIRNDPKQVQNLVINHLFQGEVSAEEVEPAINVKITEGDIKASNGVVHVTDDVLMGQ